MGWGGTIFKEITVIQKRVYNSAEFAIRDISYVLFMLLKNIMIDLIKGGVLRGWSGCKKKNCCKFTEKGEPNLPYYRGIVSQ